MYVASRGVPVNEPPPADGRMACPTTTSRYAMPSESPAPMMLSNAPTTRTRPLGGEARLHRGQRANWPGASKPQEPQRYDDGAVVIELVFYTAHGSESN